MIKLFSFCAFILALWISHEVHAGQENKMDTTKFDFNTYGLVKKNELAVTIHLAKIPEDQIEKKKASGGIQKPKLSPENNDREGEEILSAQLEFKNISSRELHIENRLWFIRLNIHLNDKKLEYTGPMVSMGPPSKSDFKTLQANESFQTEQVNLNSYYIFPKGIKGTLRVEYSYDPNAELAVSVLKLP